VLAGQVLSRPVPTAPVQVLLLAGLAGGLIMPDLVRRVIERTGWGARRDG